MGERTTRSLSPAPGSLSLPLHAQPSGAFDPSNDPAMVDIDLLVQHLRAKGHDVRSVHRVPDNAGEYEFIIDDNVLNLEDARRLLEQDEAK